MCKKCLKKTYSKCKCNTVLLSFISLYLWHIGAHGSLYMKLHTGSALMSIGIVWYIWAVLLACGSERTGAKLQLQGACCILKLARQPVFVDMMSYKHLHVLAVLVVVSIWCLWRVVVYYTSCGMLNCAYWLTHSKWQSILVFATLFCC